MSHSEKRVDMKNTLLKTLFLNTCLSFLACYSGGDLMQGLAPTPDENQGPNIEWDVFAEPVPEIPFPNNIASRPSNKTLTGRLLNIPMNAETKHENKFRRLIEEKKVAYKVFDVDLPDNLVQQELDLISQGIKKEDVEQNKFLQMFLIDLWSGKLCDNLVLKIRMLLRLPA